jgi:hypothetical protein
MTPGSAFAVNGGSLTVTGSTISGNLPSGNSEFSQTGAAVTLQQSTVDAVAMPGTYKLGNDGFTPGS